MKFKVELTQATREHTYLTPDDGGKRRRVEIQNLRFRAYPRNDEGDTRFPGFGFIELEISEIGPEAAAEFQFGGEFILEVTKA